jgi:uncharacterized membrane protein YphA (DoxX/SURF4 family)
MKGLDRWVAARPDLPFDLVRIYLGIGLFIKAFYFIGNRDYLDQLLEETGDLWWIPAAAAHYVIMSHLAGGVSLALGFLTRIGAAIQIPVLAGAVFYVHLPKAVSIGPRQDLEFSALVLFLLVLLFVRGAGRLSVDFHLAGKREAGA